ncbi:MAG: hypothetical protein IJV98_08330 [Clostridia bacterium]|nr:hypothetical protein [Clostridia bacterium]
MKKIHWKGLFAFLMIPMLLLASCGTGTSGETTASPVTASTTASPVTESTTASPVTATTTEAKDCPIEYPTVPPVFYAEDEMPATRVFTAENDDGLVMTVTLHGYRSESQGKEFYVKRTEYMTVDVTLENTAKTSFWQFLSSLCRGGQYDHTHELRCDLTSVDGKRLTKDTYILACPAMIDVWEIEAGARYAWTVKLAAGEPQFDDFDLPAAQSTREGIKLYDFGIYEDVSCFFTGDISFAYAAEYQTRNDHTLSVPVAVEFVYVESHA